MAGGIEHQQMATGTDEALIGSFQEGNEAAFTIIVGRYKDPLVNFVYRYLGDYSDADDVVQETFVRLYNNRHAYKPIAKFSTWLYTVAANLAKTQLRRRKRMFAFSRTRGSDEERDAPVEIPDQGESTDARADRALRQELIQRALDELPPKFREAVVLCDIQDLSYEEICAITGVNIGTVKSRLSRGRALLQKLLKNVKEEL
jgi:RNA polymerase sigma-70 factor (ECF subfamily)